MDIHCVNLAYACLQCYWVCYSHKCCYRMQKPCPVAVEWRALMTVSGEGSRTKLWAAGQICGSELPKTHRLCGSLLLKSPLQAPKPAIDIDGRVALWFWINCTFIHWCSPTFREDSWSATMVPSLPWLRWNCSRSLKGKSQMTSELRTKNGSLSTFSSSRANAKGPAGHTY